MNNSQKKWIKIIGAKEHNLKNISVDIPKEAFTVITGPSGSGKSSLALDVLYTEGKRRYIESLSSYARQFLGLPKKPDVEKIEGLCPAIAIDQKTVGANPRSTVGTITEIYDYLRVLFARVGELKCPNCFTVIKAESSDKLVESIVSYFQDKLIILAAPIAIYKKGEFTHEIEKLFSQGYYRFIIDGKKYNFKSTEEIKKLKLKKKEQHNIDMLLDSCEVILGESARLQEAIERSFKLANGICKIICQEQDYLYAADKICLHCNYSFDEIEPRLFSFNSPIGACKNCSGLGIIYQVEKSQEYKYINKEKFIENETVCPDCQGKRLNKKALAITIRSISSKNSKDSKNIYELGNLSITRILEFFNNLELPEFQAEIVKQLLQEIVSRLNFLSNVGLGYLTLNRTARTLSGGEGQRIRLATQIGSYLSGILYILDEPSIGLHQRDNDRLINTLHNLRDLGNTVVVVEHDTDTMLNADYIIDMGPAAGILGGTVVACGTPQEIANNNNSLTGAYLNNKNLIEVPKIIRNPKGFITLKDIKSNNLKNLTVKFPVGVFCGISGVSGSGKSTLIMQELIPILSKTISKNRKYIPEWVKNLFTGKERLEGTELIDNLVVIDQTPIGRTPRSTPATYLGIFDNIRELYANLPESNIRGYKLGQFSFNVKEGRCSKCSGEGIITVSMHFLSDVIMTCNECKGARYNNQTLEIIFKQKNIAQILDMTAYEAYDFFKAHTAISRKLKVLCDVGLDYIKLGQASTTLSGGEAQRVKLSSELSKRGTKTLYILDEPTTGLHSSDVKKLLEVLQNLVNKNNTVIVIEHNLDILKSTDYIIDLGPEGGDNGGEIIAQGTPKQVAQNSNSYTGKYLKTLIFNN